MADAATDPTHSKLRASRIFQAFLCALALSTVCIFIRSIFRVAELSEGWEGALIKNQKLFIGLEGVMVTIAVLSLNAFHPGLCFREGYTPKSRGHKSGRKFWGKKGSSDVGKMEKGSPTREESERPSMA